MISSLCSNLHFYIHSLLQIHFLISQWHISSQFCCCTGPVLLVLWKLFNFDSSFLDQSNERFDRNWGKGSPQMSLGNPPSFIILTSPNFFGKFLQWSNSPAKSLVFKVNYQELSFNLTITFSSKKLTFKSYQISSERLDDLNLRKWRYCFWFYLLSSLLGPFEGQAEVIQLQVSFGEWLDFSFQ